MSEGYGGYCSIICMNKSEEHKNNVKITNNNRYGGNSPISSPIVFNKIKETINNRYGVDNIFKNIDYISEKTFNKYGVTHISKLETTKEKINKTNKDKYGVKTPLLLKENRLKGVDVKLNVFLEKYSSLMVKDILINDITINCSSCGNDYIIDRNLLFYRFNNVDNPCTICNPVSSLTSFKENDLQNFISGLNIDFIVNDRKILDGQEIDIYIPSKKIAIEFNGLYWHSDIFKSKDYHMNKTNLCEKKGIRLIHIFEDEWDNKKDIVKSRIKSILQLTENIIYGRKCIIKTIPIKIKSDFLNENHIQGSTGSKINLGLYYENNLVSVMTFGRGRIIMKGNSSEYELIRFCNKLNTTVIGGASKLLKHFERYYKPNVLNSYSDKRWNTGNLYRILGFNQLTDSNPNYYYVVDKKREYRFKYRKNILVSMGYDKNKSEKLIMFERGINRIYDCGNFVFKKTY